MKARIWLTAMVMAVLALSAGCGGDDEGGGGGTGGGGDEPCDMGSQSDIVTVDVENAPKGAVVLIGKIALTRPTSTWGGQVIQPVCCDGEDCVVEATDPPTGTQQGGPVK